MKLQYITKNIHIYVYIALIFSAAVLVMFGLEASKAEGAFNEQINYQGKLTDSSGSAVSDGDYDMEFKLYTEVSGGTAIWTETLTGANQVTVTSGLFSVMLGSTTSLSSVDFDQTLYLGVNIESDGEMTPRKVLGAVPAAFEAGQLDGIDSTQFLRSDEPDTLASSSASTLLTINQSGTGDILNLLDDSTEVFTVLDGGNVGIGTTTPSHTLSVEGNSTLGDFAVAGYFTATTTATSSIPTLSVTGLFYDTNGTGGADGQVLSTTGSGVEWVSTTTWDTTLTEDEVEAFIFDADNSGTLESGTLALDSLSFTGTLNHEYGGLEADVSAYTGLIGITGGATSEVDTESELETHLGSLDVVTVTTDDITSANLATLLSDETGSGNAVFSASPTFTGTAVFATASTSDLIVSDTATTTNFTITTLTNALLSTNNLGQVVSTTSLDISDQTNLAATWPIVLTDDTLSWDGIATSSNATAGTLAYWSSGTELADVATGTLATDATGLEFNNARSLVGGAATLSLSSGYTIPLTASTTNWNNFYDTPSTVITAGDGLTWSTNTLNFDGGNAPGGELGGTWASPTVDAEITTLEELSDVDTFTQASGDVIYWDGDSWANTATTSWNTNLTQEEVEDFVGGMVDSNTETLITVTYEDSDGTLDFVVDNDLSNYSNASSNFFDTAGTNLNSSGSTVNLDDTITLTGASTTNATTTNLIVNSSLSLAGEALTAWSGNGIIFNSGVLDFDCSDVTDTANDGLTCSTEDLVVAADANNFIDDDWGDLSVSSNVVTLDNDVVGTAEIADADFGAFTFSGGAATLDDDTVSSSTLNISNWTDGYVLQASTTATGGFDWVATTTLGFVDTTLTEDEVEAFIFDADNSGTLESGTLALDSLSFTGTLNHEYGGLEADVSAYTGLIGITGGATSEVDTESELETHLGSLDVVTVTTDDITSANLATLLSDETGSGNAVFSASPTFTGTAVFATASTSDLIVSDTATTTNFTITTLTNALLSTNNLGQVVSTTSLDISDQTNLAATWPIVLTDDTLSWDGIATSSNATAGTLAYWSSGTELADVATGTLATDATGLEFNNARSLVGGAATLSLSSGYTIPLTASTTNWNNFYDTPSTVITAGDGIEWSTNTLNVNDVTAAMLASSDFGDFTCNGTTCSFDDDTVSSSTLNISNWTDGYVLQASTTATGGFDWVATTTLGITSTEINNLETIATGIADTEIFIGTGVNTGNYAALSGDATLANDGTLTLADNAVSSSTLDISNWTNGYILLASTTASGGFDWIATSTLGIALSDTTGTLGETRGGTGVTSYSTGDILYADGSNSLITLSAGSNGNVLKLAGGVPTWGADNTGGGGGSGLWATTTNEQIIYPADTSDIVIVGANATSSTNTIFEVQNGNSYFEDSIGIGTTTPSHTLSVEGNSTLGDFAVAGYFTATTTATSSIPTLSVTGLFYDTNGTGGADGQVLSTTGSGVEWVSTTTWDTTLTEDEVEAFIFDADNSGTLESGTLALDSLSFTGTLNHEYGGLEADVSAYTGLIGITGGATSEVDTESELETHLGSLDVVTVTTDDITSANLATLLSDETGSGNAVFSASPTFTGTAVFATASTSDLIVSDTATTTNFTITTLTNALLSTNNLGQVVSTTSLDISDQTNLAATWPIVLTDDTLSWDGIATSSNATAGTLAYWSSGTELADVATGTLATDATGLEFNNARSLVGGAATLSLSSGYTIPLTASTTNWNNFYDTPSTVITAGDGIEWSTNTLNVNDVTAAMLASSDFGDFTCNGTTCSFDDDTVSSSTLNISNWTDGYVLQASTTATGGFDWVATTTLGFVDTTLTEDEVEAFIFDADNSGTLESGTLALDSLSFTGTLNHEYGGLEADVSAYTGLIGITGGATSEVDTESELETHLGSLDVVTVTTDDITSANLATLLSDETGSGNAVFSASPTFTGTAVFATASTSDLIVSDTATTTNFTITTLTNALLSTNNLGQVVATSTISGSLIEDIYVLNTGDSISGNLTFSGSAANITLGSNYLSGDGDDEGVFVNSSGGVGIGIATHVDELEVASTSDAVIKIFTTSAAAGSVASLEFVTESAANRPKSAIIAEKISGSDSRHDLHFAVDTDSNTGHVVTGDAKMTIDGLTGFVGIGTTTPSHTLSVEGNSTLGDFAVAGYFTATTTATSSIPTLSVTGLFYDTNGTGGADGQVLSTTGSGVEWVSTTTWDTTLTEDEVEAFIFDADNSGTLESGTLALDSLSFTGTLNHEYGGLEADVSAYTGLIGITGGATSEVDTESELETHLGSLDVVTVTTDDITSANLATLLSDETGSGNAVFSASPTFTGTAVFATASTSDLIVSDTATTTNFTITTLTNALLSTNNLGQVVSTTSLDISDQTNLAATWPIVLTDDTLSWDGIATSSNATAGTLAYWSSGTELADVATGTLATDATGLEFNNARSLVGGAATLSLSSGYTIPLTASTTNWNNFYDTPSTVITAGDGLTWSTNTLNFDGGNAPGGELGGTWASPTVDAEITTLEELSDVDTFTQASGDVIYWDGDSWANTATTSWNTNLTQEEVEDFVGGMVDSNTETLITVTYEDSDGTLDFVVDNDLSNYSNASSNFFDTAGTNLNSSGSTVNLDDTITLTGASTTNATTTNLIVNSSLSLAGEALTAWSGNGIIFNSGVLDFDCSDVTDTANDGLTCSTEDLVVAADANNFIDDDWGDLSVSSNVVTLDNDVVGTAEIADADFGAFTFSGGAATLDDDTVSSSTLNISNWTDGYVLQASTTATGGFDWVATTTLGFGDNTFIGLTDTPSSFNANRIPFTNSGGTALTDTSTFVFTGTNLGIGDATPAAALTVGNGDDFQVSSTGLVSLPDGSDLAPALGFVADDDLGIYRVTGDTLGFIANSAEVLRIESDGDLVFNQDTNTTIGRPTTDQLALTTGGTEGLRLDENQRLGITDTDPDYRLEVLSSSGSGYFGVTNSTDGDVFVINGSGNVGIGTTTPSHTLSVEGNSTLGDFAVAGYFTATTTATSSIPTLSVTGLFYDTNGTGGADGQVLSTTGSGVEWVSTTTWDTTLTEDEVEAFIFDADNSGTLESGTLALDSLSFTGTLNHEYGGLEADVSAYTGLIGITGGATSEVDTESELETHLGSLDVVTVTTDDITSANLATLLSDETGSGNAVFSASPTFTGTAVFATASTSDLIVSDTATTTNFTITTLTNALLSTNNLGQVVSTTSLDISDQTNLAATWPIVLTDDTLSWDGIATSSNATAGTLAYWSSGTELADVATGTLATDATGLEFNNARSLVGGAATLSLSSGYTIPLTASTTNWNNFYDTPSTVITAGDGLTWSTNTLNFDGGNAPGGELGGTWASPTVDAEITTLEELSDVDTFTQASGDVIYWDGDSWANTATTSWNTNLTQEEVEDFVGGMVDSNTETLITVTYEDSDGTLDFVVDNDLSNYSNASSNFFDTAGTNLNSSGSTVNLDDTITLTGASTTNATTTNLIVNSSLSLAGEALTAWSGNGIIFNSGVLDFDCSDVTDTANDGLTCSTEDLVVAADANNFIDDDWGDLSVSSNVVTLDNDVVGTAEIADADFGAFTFSGGAATLDDDTVSSSTLNISNWTDGYVLQASTTATGGFDWVATTTLGFGDNTFIGLTDTPSSFNANRIPFTNSGGTALTDTSTFVFDGTNLGIGTTSPQALLHVSGGWSGIVPNAVSDFVVEDDAQAAIQILSANDNTGSIYFGDDGNSIIGRIIYDHVANDLSLWTNGSEQLTIDSSGNVNIATTSPTTAAKLFVEGDTITDSVAGHFITGDGGSMVGLIVDADGDSSDAIIKARSNSTANPTDDDTKFIVLGNGDVGIGTSSPTSLLHLESGDPEVLFLDSDTNSTSTITQASNNFVIANHMDGALVFETNSTEVARFTSVGRLGINTVSPNSLLSVAGNAAIGSTFAPDHTAPTDGLLVEGSTGIGTSTVNAHLTVQTTGTTDILNLLETGGTEVFTVLENGNVGVGTSTPNGKLHVFQGDSGQAGVTFSADGLIIEDDGATGLSIFTPSSDAGSIYFGDEVGSGRGRIIYDHSDDSLALTTGSNERFRIDSSGNVGIGTTSPYAPLSVNGETVASHFTATTTATSSIPTLSVTGLFYDTNGTGGADGQVLSTTGSGVDWVATSSLGLGDNTFLGLSDTPSSFTANRVPYTNSGGTALTDSANLIFDGTNLGIGSTSPAARLAVDGSWTDTVNGKLTINSFDNETEAVAFQLIDENNNEVFHIRSGGGGGNDTGIVYAAGAIGIGSTTPGASDLLSLDGSGVISQTINSTNNSAILYLDRGDSGDSAVVGYDTGGTNNWFSGILGGTSDFSILDGAANQMFVVVDNGSTGSFGFNDVSPDFSVETVGSSGSGYFGVTNSTDGDIFVIDSSGNVGIGSSSPGYGAELVIEGSGAINQVIESTNDDASLRLVRGGTDDSAVISYYTGTTADWFLGGLASGSNFGLVDNSGSNVFFTVIDDGTTGSFGFNDSTPDFQFETVGASDNGYFGITNSLSGDILTVDSSGDVGISTTSPAATLDVWGSFLVGTSTSFFTVNESNGVSTFGDSSGTGDAIFQFADDTDAWVMGYRSSDKTFNIASSTEFDVTSALSIAKNGDTTIVGSAVTCTIGNGSGATNCSSSDERLKDEITPLDSESILAGLYALEPVSFYWSEWMQENGAASTTQFGFIAQDVEKIFPNLATQDENTGYFKLDYQGIIPPMVLAIQELNLNLETIASSTASSTLASRAFADSFFDGLFDRLTGWFADASNGIAEFFADRVRAKEICLSDSEGGQTCVTKSQLDALLAGAAIEASTGADGGSDTGSDGGNGSDTTPDTVATSTDDGTDNTATSTDSGVDDSTASTTDSGTEDAGTTEEETTTTTEESTETTPDEETTTETTSEETIEPEPTEEVVEPEPEPEPAPEESTVTEEPAASESPA